MNSDLYDHISTLLPGRVYFGGYPSETMLSQLEQEQFTHIVNLTIDNEMAPYRSIRMLMYEYPIPDHGVPRDILEYCEFLCFLRRLCVNENLSKIYIHCRGGHGRSSMICVSLWMLLHPDMELQPSITHVNQCHVTRKVLREKWRNKRVPFNHHQSTFLHKIHRTIFLNTSLAHASFSFSTHYVWVLPRRVHPTDISLEEVWDEMTANGANEHDRYDRVGEMIQQHYEQHRDLKFRLQLTFLRSFHFVGVSPELSAVVRSHLYRIRENLFAV
jgi:hypothetical protein